MSQPEKSDDLNVQFAAARAEGKRHIVDNQGRTLVRSPYGGSTIVTHDPKSDEQFVSTFTYS